MSLSATKNRSPWTRERRSNSTNYGMTAKLSNTINAIGFGAFNHKGEINREDILTSYSKKILEETWIQISNFVKKNYEAGKGTNIKGFGVFTFTNSEYNLEGTTNQYKRDLKLKRPVFIVSNEFLDFLKPGQFTKRGGLIYYTQTLNNNICHVKFSYTELAYALNISKEECQEIITTMIKDMGDQIIQKKFVSREMPGLGTILLRGNVFGIKFYDNFNLEIYKQPEKYSFTKKNLELYMNVHKTDQAQHNVLNAEKAVKELNPKDSVITHLVNGADTWMQENLGINPTEYDDDTETHNNFNKVENYDRNQKWRGGNFFNGPTHNSLYNPPKGLFRKSREHPYSGTSHSANTSASSIELKTIRSLNYPKEILEAIVANKGQIIKEMKNFDKRNNGLISRFEVARSFQKANIHPSLGMNNFNDIIKIYADKLDFIDYLKLITSLIKEIKQILKNTSFSKYGFDDLSSTFNNKFRLGKITDIGNNKKLSQSFNNGKEVDEKIKNEFTTDINLFNENEYKNLLVPVVDVEKEITTIKLIFDEAMNHKNTYFRSVDHEIFKDNNNKLTYVDFIKLLKIFGISYPTDKIFKILKFIHIEDPKNMTLNLLNDKLKSCKISSSEMSSNDLEDAMRSILFDPKLNLQKNLFKNSNTDLTLKQFLKQTHNKTIYSDEILKELFNILSSKKPTLSFNEFTSFYSNPIYSDPNISSNLTNRFFEQSCEKILAYIKSLNKNTNQYFNHLLEYNYLRAENTMGVQDFILAMLQEPYKPMWSESQLEFIFNKMDTNKDGRLDRNEFKYAVTKENNSLLKMLDIIKSLRLTREDVAYRLEIKPDDESKNLTFYQFKNKLRKMDYHYTNEFIEGLFTELCGGLDKTLNCKLLLDSLDVYKKGAFTKTNNETFKKNFIANIQKVVDYHTLKDAFEKEDKKFSGKISKAAFCKVINQFTNEFKDEDIMKFVRIAQVTDTTTYEVIYQDFMNMIYYNERLDHFLLCVNEIKKLCDRFGGDIKKVISYINNNQSQNSNDYLTVDTLLKYLKSIIETEEFNPAMDITINKTLVCKFDLDSDGKVTFEDLRGILQRYSNTAFFKYENSEKGQLVNLYASDIVTDEQFKAIVREIKATMKKKNITPVGLFKKLDEDNDGFINNYEFNKNITGIVDISPATKDKFFNYLDYYHNGMVDLETFLLRFKEFRSDEVIVRNNNKIENVILDELSKFISKNSDKLNDTEIFSMIDKDSDGLISLEDFKHFVIDSLGVSKIEFNDYKLERVMQSISLSKNKNISLGDIREFMNKALSNQVNSYYVDLKETFKETTNQNLYRGKKNTEWITQAIERFGMYITEKYDGATKFFELFADKTNNKFKLEHFIKFHENNYECFHGFNLTRDELLAIYTSLDSQKKNYLTLEDLKNKVDLFDFYRKMHLDIKNFFVDNFPTNIDSFKFFLSTDINKINTPGGGRTGLVAIDPSAEKMRMNQTVKGFYRPFDSSGIINSNASGTLLRKFYLNEIKNKTKTNNKFLTLNPNNPGTNATFITKKQFFDGINHLFPKKYPTDTILKYMRKYFNIGIELSEVTKTQEQCITFSQFTFVYYGKVCNDNDLFEGLNQKLATFNNGRQNKISTTRTSITARCLSAFDELKVKNNKGRVPFAHNLYPNEEEILGPHPVDHMDHPLDFLAHEKLITPFDTDPLEKVRRVIVSSPNQNYIEIMKKFMKEHVNTGGVCNEFEFKNMLKGLCLGLTNIEIDDIIRRSGRTYDGKLNMNEFFKFVTSKDKNINKAVSNLKITLTEIKQLLYKYYSNPKLAFTFSDSGQSNLMDFEKYRTIVCELYRREDRPLPNFALLKNTYDYIDLRKDGMIDMVEWTNAFGGMSGKLDALKPRSAVHKTQLKSLRRWETSNDVINIYKEISRNRKIISQKVKESGFGGKDCTVIQEDNLINILKDIFPLYCLTNTQWKMIVEIGDRDTQGFINFETFIKLVENCSKREEMPRFK